MTTLREDQDGAPYPDVAQGETEAAIVLRAILDLHRIDGDDRCGHDHLAWPCTTVAIVLGGDGSEIVPVVG